MELIAIMIFILNCFCNLLFSKNIYNVEFIALLQRLKKLTQMNAQYQIVAQFLIVSKVT